MENDLRIYTKGNAFKDGVYDIRTLELIINSHRTILDRLIAVQLGRRQLTPIIKKQIDYDVKRRIAKRIRERPLFVHDEDPDMIRYQLSLKIKTLMKNLSISHSMN